MKRKFVVSYKTVVGGASHTIELDIPEGITGLKIYPYGEMHCSGSSGGSSESINTGGTILGPINIVGGGSGSSKLNSDT